MTCDLMVKLMVFAWQIRVWAAILLSYGVGFIYMHEDRSAQDNASPT